LKYSTCFILLYAIITWVGRGTVCVELFIISVRYDPGGWGTCACFDWGVGVDCLKNLTQGGVQA